jgi:ABC-2 type transport system permease protein
VPLLEDEGQPYISYRKGAIAMYTLHDFLGADSVNTALRRYFEKFNDNVRPYPTSLDLYAQLRAITPDSLQSVLTDWFETVTLWDVKTTRADVQPTSNGDFRVTLTVVGKKMRADSVGHTRAVPMDDYVEIGAFASSKGDLGAPLYLRRQRIRSGTQTITITVPVRPERAGVDPYHKLIERQRDDNLVALASAAARKADSRHRVGPPSDQSPPRGLRGSAVGGRMPFSRM